MGNRVPVKCDEQPQNEQPTLAANNIYDEILAQPSKYNTQNNNNDDAESVHSVFSQYSTGRETSNMLCNLFETFNTSNPSTTSPPIITMQPKPHHPHVTDDSKSVNLMPALPSQPKQQNTNIGGYNPFANFKGYDANINSTNNSNSNNQHNNQYANNNQYNNSNSNIWNSFNSTSTTSLKNNNNQNNENINNNENGYHQNNTSTAWNGNNINNNNNNNNNINRNINSRKRGRDLVQYDQNNEHEHNYKKRKIDDNILHEEFKQLGIKVTVCGKEEKYEEENEKTKEENKLNFKRKLEQLQDDNVQNESEYEAMCKSLTVDIRRTIQTARLHAQTTSPELNDWKIELNKTKEMKRVERNYENNKKDINLRLKQLPEYETNLIKKRKNQEKNNGFYYNLPTKISAYENEDNDIEIVESKQKKNNKKYDDEYEEDDDLDEDYDLNDEYDHTNKQYNYDKNNEWRKETTNSNIGGHQGYKYKTYHHDHSRKQAHEHQANYEKYNRDKKFTYNNNPGYNKNRNNYKTSEEVKEEAMYGNGNKRSFGGPRSGYRGYRGRGFD